MISEDRKMTEEDDFKEREQESDSYKIDRE